ncbi:Aspartate racemase [Lutibaculum baratangense AMV1]|uniref:Aspartate racemase n=1 Tax=Lutibaculum baratangense AMV1 TaxID=631454 RepID=V4TFI5_9HYPH|nr:Aspartate racemase [Lutibaculum baratangense AMV1]
MSELPHRRRIGILGGMGPEATVLLMQRIIERTTVSDDQDHVPMIVDNNPQVPSRVKAIIEGTGEDPAPVLAAMARGLEAAGADALAMPCNTAHHYAATIAGAVRIPFLDMVELSAARAEGLGARRAGILGSPALKITGIFDRAFAARGLGTVYPENQDRLLDAIRRVKVSSRSREARHALAQAAEELGTRGADVLIVACSEFSIIADAIPSGPPAIDTVDVLADAAIAFSCGEAVEAEPA